MKNRTTYTNYSHISSFEDFRAEREQLLMKRELIEVKLNLSYLKLRNAFSFTDTLISLANEYVIPKIKNIFGGFFKNNEDENNSEN